MTGSRKPLKFWSLTVQKNYRPLPGVERMKLILTEFSQQWCFQLEKGRAAGKEHYQVRLILREAQMTETLLTVFEARGFDRKDLTIIPESNNSICQGGLAFYVMKDDTRLDGPWNDPSYTRPNLEMYDYADLGCMSEPLPFQRSIMDMCEIEPDDRTLHWVYNAAGRAGKSKLMKYMRCNQKFIFARVPLGTATQIKTSVIEKGRRKIYMVDLPRVRGSDERQQELFSALEEIKNGWVESAMYGKVQELLMNPPHIWIFSNELPNRSFASEDRWKVWTIDEGSHLIPYVPDFTDQFPPETTPFTEA